MLAGEVEVYVLRIVLYDDKCVKSQICIDSLREPDARAIFGEWMVMQGCL